MRIDRPNRSGLAVFLAVFVPLAFVYLLTANWSLPYGFDALMNAQTGYELGRFGDPILPPEAEIHPANPNLVGRWTRPVGHEYVSNYPPGAALLVAPLYAVWPEDARTVLIDGSGTGWRLRVPPIAPAAIVSAIAVALAMGLMALAANRLTSSRHAIAVGFVFGLGTAAWSVAAHQLWQHGPAMLWIATGLVMSIQYPLASGLAFGLAAVTRPHTVVVGLGVAAYRWIAEKRPWPAVGMAVLAASGVLAVVLYNLGVFGEASLSGGYGDSMIRRLASIGNVGWFVGNVGRALIDPVRGLFVYSPFLIFLIPGVPVAWRESPWWVRGAALGGIVYLLIQLKANRFGGGDGFFSYRYPLEALLAMTPLFVVSYERWLADRRYARFAFLVLCAYAGILQASAALFFTP